MSDEEVFEKMRSCTWDSKMPSQRYLRIAIINGKKILEGSDDLENWMVMYEEPLDDIKSLIEEAKG